MERKDPAVPRVVKSMLTLRTSNRWTFALVNLSNFQVEAVYTLNIKHIQEVGDSTTEKITGAWDSPQGLVT